MCVLPCKVIASLQHRVSVCMCGCTTLQVRRYCHHSMDLLWLPISIWHRWWWLPRWNFSEVFDVRKLGMTLASVQCDISRRAFARYQCVLSKRSCERNRIIRVCQHWSYIGLLRACDIRVILVTCDVNSRHDAGSGCWTTLMTSDKCNSRLISNTFNYFVLCVFETHFVNIFCIIFPTQLHVFVFTNFVWNMVDVCACYLQPKLVATSTTVERWCRAGCTCGMTRLLASSTLTLVSFTVRH